MGVIVGIDVEGEDRPIVNERTDGKPLATIVGDWIKHSRMVQLLGLSSASLEALTLLDETTYASPGEKLVKQNYWQDPRKVLRALQELLAGIRKVGSTPSLVSEIESAEVWVHFDREMLDNGLYDIAIEDSIKTCEWAERRHRRVRLRAS